MKSIVLEPADNFESFLFPNDGFDLILVSLLSVARIKF